MKLRDISDTVCLIIDWRSICRYVNDGWLFSISLSVSQQPIIHPATLYCGQSMHQPATDFIHVVATSQSIEQTTRSSINLSINTTLSFAKFQPVALCAICRSLSLPISQALTQHLSQPNKRKTKQVKILNLPNKQTASQTANLMISPASSLAISQTVSQLITAGRVSCSGLQCWWFSFVAWCTLFATRCSI